MQISKRVFRENKAHQTFRKTNISYPLIRRCTCAYQRVINVRFSECLMCFVFLKHPSWDSPFCLIIDDSLAIFKCWDSKYVQITSYVNFTAVLECSVCHYWTSSFSNVWSRVLRMSKSFLQSVGFLWWWVRLSVVLTWNDAEQAISHHHHNHHHHHHHHHHRHHHHHHCRMDLLCKISNHCKKPNT